MNEDQLKKGYACILHGLDLSTLTTHHGTPTK